MPLARADLATWAMLKIAIASGSTKDLISRPFCPHRLPARPGPGIEHLKWDGQSERAMQRAGPSAVEFVQGRCHRVSFARS